MVLMNRSSDIAFTLWEITRISSVFDSMYFCNRLNSLFRLFHVSQLPDDVMCSRFDPEGNLLAIGLSTGTIKVSKLFVPAARCLSLLCFFS